MVEVKNILTIVAVPINDTRFTKDDKTNKDAFETSQDQFKENLVKLSRLAKDNSGNLVFIGMTKVNESELTSISERWKIYYNNEVIKDYNKILKDFCKKENVHFIDMFDLLKGEDLDDGLHPNSEGHKKMFERIKDFLIKNEIVK